MQSQETLLVIARVRSKTAIRILIFKFSSLKSTFCFVLFLQTILLTGPKLAHIIFDEQSVKIILRNSAI